MNKTIYKIFPLSVFLLLLILLFISGCSKQADNLVVVQSDTESCTTCHGSNGHAYPPKSLAGHTLPTEQGVGAHEVHLNPGSAGFTAGVECDECHLPVTNYYDSTHLNGTGKATVIFGTIAKTKTTGYTPNPVWNSTNQTCANTYCHGYFKGGNPTTSTVTFTSPGSVKCGSCHGNPTTGNPKPLTTHQYYPDNCWYCHGAVIDSSGVIFNKSRHVNGVIDYNVND